MRIKCKELQKVIKLKIKELRLLNSKIYEDGKLIYEGKIDEAPEEIKIKEYKKIKFEGTDIEVKIQQERNKDNGMDKRTKRCYL